MIRNGFRDAMGNAGRDIQRRQLLESLSIEELQSQLEKKLEEFEDRLQRDEEDIKRRRAILEKVKGR